MCIYLCCIRPFFILHLYSSKMLECRCSNELVHISRIRLQIDYLAVLQNFSNKFNLVTHIRFDSIKSTWIHALLWTTIDLIVSTDLMKDQMEIQQNVAVIYLKMAIVPIRMNIKIYKLKSTKPIILAAFGGIETRYCSFGVVVRFCGPHQSLRPAKLIDATRTKYVVFCFNESIM